MPSDATLWGVGWGGGCLILDTDTESYVTSLPVCVCVCVCVCVLMSLQFQLWMIQEIKPLKFCSSFPRDVFRFWPNNTTIPSYGISFIPGDFRVRAVTCVRNVLCRLMTKTQ